MEIEIHRAKELILTVDQLRNYLYTDSLTDDIKKTMVKRIDKIREILLEAKLKEETNGEY